VADDRFTAMYEDDSFQDAPVVADRYGRRLPKQKKGDDDEENGGAGAAAADAAAGVAAAEGAGGRRGAGHAVRVRAAQEAEL